jgi:GTP-binding protein
MKLISKLTFLGGAGKVTDVERLQLPVAPRVAFAGRSNVVKSSLLNSLTKSQLASVSAEPGKTREMNFYLWPVFGKIAILVDLPGYGYARVAKSLRDEWGQQIALWLRREQQLAQVLCLVDGRVGFMPQDRELIGYLQEAGRPHSVVFTKMDKWKSKNQQRQAQVQLTEFCKGLGVVDFVFASSKSADGVAPVKQLIHEKVFGA